MRFQVLGIDLAEGFPSIVSVRVDDSDREVDNFTANVKVALKISDTATLAEVKAIAIAAVQERFHG